jgi:hypothetical protein
MQPIADDANFVTKAIYNLEMKRISAMSVLHPSFCWGFDDSPPDGRSADYLSTERRLSG